MKRQILKIAGAALVFVTICGMTASATEYKKESKTRKEDIIVDYYFIEEYMPQELYALDGAEIFQSADVYRKIGILTAGTKISSYQKTTNGYYYGTTDGNESFYIHESAVSTKPETKAAVPLTSNEEVCDEEGILFIFTSFGEMESAIIKNPQTNQKIILKGMGMYDFESYDFLTEETSKICLTKNYTDGSIIEQVFFIDEDAKQVGIYDDGSFGKSWMEINGQFLYEQ